jgi:hypothetical protein
MKDACIQCGSGFQPRCFYRNVTKSIAAEPRSCVRAFSHLLAQFVLGTAGLAHADAALLDDFQNMSAWKALASDQVSASLHPLATMHGKALCLAYDFNGVSGYAAMRRVLPINFPPNYEFDFKVRGSGPSNAFEFKLIDASGDNVWWVSKPNTTFTPDWSPVRYKKRHISPAWGPLTDKTLRKTQFVEFTVSANSGGKGEVCIEDLRFRELALPPATLPAPRVTASSGHVPADLLDHTEVVRAARQRRPWNLSHPLADWNRNVWAYANELGRSRVEDPLPITDTYPFSSSLTPDLFWRSEDSTEQTITIDFGFEREFGGLSLLWLPGLQASDYRIEFSDDGRRWRLVRHVLDSNGGNDHLRLAESETRFVRLRMSAGPARRFGLAAIAVEPLEFGATANAFVESLARDLPRGLFPRGFSGEQTYWTLIGVDGGHESGLLGEDGAVEVARGGFSIVPLVAGGRPVSDSAAFASGWSSPECTRVAASCGSGIGTTGLYDWSRVRIDQSLPDGYLPMPRVDWSYQHSMGATDPCPLSADAELRRIEGGSSQKMGRTLEVAPWHLAIDTFAKADADSSHLFASYTLTNVSDAAAEYRLLLTIQPFQVNPPVQFLTTPGGVSPIRELGFDGKAISVNDEARVWPLQATDAFVVTPFDQDMIVQRLTCKEWPSNRHVVDDTGLASGVLNYRIELAAHASKTISLDIPLRGNRAAPVQDQDNAQAWVDAQREQVAAAWKEKLNRVTFTVPPQAQPIVDTLRTALAHILISRDGVQIRPGTRSYARSWIRDGAMTAEALLRMGHAQEARDFLEWFAPYQFENGKVPCCVDARGSDPVPENDSHGELIYLIAEVARYTQDRTLAEKMWLHVDKSTRYMDELRASERSEANRGTEKYGLLPPSISHEGYSSKPAYSHWDNFWGLTGYNSAIELATMLDRKDDVARLTASRNQFRDDIFASLDASTKKFGINYIPGAADLGDFDATSTTIALAPGGQLQQLPADLVFNTFERYWNEFVARRDGTREWKDYTPYEWRNVGAFIRLGWRERALEAIDFFFKDRRPPAWNQWAEVVGKDYRKPRFIGDMPHGWVASDFIRSALDLFAYEREADDSIVLAAGIPEAWLAGDVVAISELQTAHGPLSYHLSADAQSLHLNLRAEQERMPAGGYILKWPLDAEPGATRINGRKAVWVNGELHIDQVPAEIVANRHSHRDVH